MSILVSILIQISWEKLNSSPRAAILRKFQNQEYCFTNLQSPGKVQAEEKEGNGKYNLQQRLILKYVFLRQFANYC